MRVRTPGEWVKRCGLFVILTLSLGAILSMSISACIDQRFPVCKTNADCVEPDAGAVCFNLRCVGCQYDIDCKGGEICSGDNTCVSIESKGAPEPGGDAGTVKWEAGNWAQCAEKCKDDPCIKKCSEKFEK